MHPCKGCEKLACSKAGGDLMGLRNYLFSALILSIIALSFSSLMQPMASVPGISTVSTITTTATSVYTWTWNNQTIITTVTYTSPLFILTTLNNATVETTAETNTTTITLATTEANITTTAMPQATVTITETVTCTLPQLTVTVTKTISAQFLQQLYGLSSSRLWLLISVAAIAIIIASVAASLKRRMKKDKTPEPKKEELPATSESIAATVEPTTPKRLHEVKEEEELSFEEWYKRRIGES
jgi:hypothetical protein